MANQPGLDALMDALRKSGMDVDEEALSGKGGANSSGEKSGSTKAASGKGGTGSRSKGSSSSASRGKDFSKGAGGGMFSNLGDRLKRGARKATGSDDGDADGGFDGDDTPHFSFDGEFAERFGSVSTGKKVVIAVVCVLLLAGAYWWFHPPLNIQSEETWGIIVFVCIVAFVLLGGSSLVEGRRAKSAGKRFQDGKGAKSKAAKGEGKPGSVKRKLVLIPVLVCVAGLVGMLTSATFFPGNAEKFSSVLSIENLDFSQDIHEVNYSEIPVIDHDAAEILGDKQMGTIPEYVSQFEVDSLYSQINYQGSPVRVSPLNYADLFKWLTNREDGIPAYALVNMTTQDTQIVRMSDLGCDGIKYSASEPLARNIDRYVQLKYPFYMFDEKSFEIDESGHPWWICPVQSKTIGLFGGTTISRVVMCDAVSGECQDIAIEDVPEWVDRAYPSSLVIQQYNWYGAYNNGWINSWLGQQNVVKTTPGSDGEAGYNYLAKDDDVWVYTGVTSATSDSSIIGCVLVNQRTGKAHFYSIAGATEKSAMESAEGQVQNLRYTSTFPILINVSSQPTYFMALKDSAGTVKKFAMIDIQRYQNVAIGDTVADCQNAYEALLATNGVSTGTDESAGELKTTSGTISHIAQAVIDGNTHFYVKLRGSSTIYDFALPGLLGIVGFAEGDSITFTYHDGQTTSTAAEIVDGSEDPTSLEVAEANASPSGNTNTNGNSNAAGNANANTGGGGTANANGSAASNTNANASGGNGTSANSNASASGASTSNANSR